MLANVYQLLHNTTFVLPLLVWGWTLIALIFLQLGCAIQILKKKIKSLTLERNALLESDQAFRKMIYELEKCLREEKALVIQLKLDLNAINEELAQSQSQVQELSSSLN